LLGAPPHHDSTDIDGVEADVRIAVLFRHLPVEGVGAQESEFGGIGEIAGIRVATLDQNFTFNDFHFIDDPSNRIASIPVYLYKASLVYQHPAGWHLGPDITWSPARYPVDQANTDYAPPYAVIGARAGWVKDKHFRVFVQGTNLLNRHYAATVAPIADARADPDPAVFRPGVGIDLMGGIELSW
jgi:iron complex outermembrane recepter protein